MTDVEHEPVIDAILATPPRRRGRRWVSVLLIGLVFLGGVVCGGGGALLVLRSRVMEIVRHPDREAARRATNIGKQLDLTPEQTKRVQAILAQRMNSVLNNARGQMDLFSEEVGQVLTESQRERWRAFRGRRVDDWLPPPAIRPAGVDAPRPST